VRALDRLVTGDGPFAVVECAACEYGVTDPQLTDEELAPYYDAIGYYEAFYEHSGAATASPLYRLRHRFRAHSAARRHRRPPFRLEGVPSARMLDVGCGSGDLLATFAERGWETYGVDPSAAATATAERRGAKVHTGTLEDCPWEPESFQLVAFQHSLEHIVDPIDALRRARALLAPGGRLVVAVPNWACWQRRLLFRNRWFPLDLPRHQQHFSVRALARLAADLDLEVREAGTHSTAIATAYSLHYVLAGRWTPGWKLWLSYALSIPLLPLVMLGDRLGGGDCCYAVMARSA
jgi:2-polyprenyl-3-methyl-5-hydroxy-6-metoxy-1,4-benzoquinol methylase